MLVAQSLGGFTAPLVATAVALRGLVFVNAMIPVPGETANEWWGVHRMGRCARGRGAGQWIQHRFRRGRLFPARRRRTSRRSANRTSGPRPRRLSASVCDFAAWLTIPIRVVAGSDDRFFPADFQRRLAGSGSASRRTSLPGGHLIALSQPAALAAYLLST